MRNRAIICLLCALPLAGCSAILEFRDYAGELCGNGVIDPGEQCDDGELNSDITANACRKSCRVASCGDGVTDFGELCDEGANNGQQDHCNEACNGYVGGAECGDGDVQPPEVCDDGDLNGTYGHCAANCMGDGPRCGDGEVTQDEEQCDGDNLNGATCLDLGRGAGDLVCTDACQFDVADCGPPFQCVAAGQIQCGDAVSATTSDPGSFNNVDSWCGAGAGWNGPEMSYMFSTTTVQEVWVKISGLQQDVDLHVVPVGNEGDCEPAACVGTSQIPGLFDERVVFVAQPGLEYMIVVDGWNGAESPFDLQLNCYGVEICDNFTDDNGDGVIDCGDPLCFGQGNCVSETGALCGDLWDNDQDGSIDCADSDCNGFPECDCNSTLDIQCGSTLTDVVSDGSDSNDQVIGWCGLPIDHSGFETVYNLANAPSNGQVTVTLDNIQGGDLNLFVVASPNSVCQAGNCVDTSMNPGFDPESVTFTPQVQTSYFIVVDGRDGAAGSFDISVSCF
ncbi:MAG: PPC domain-containing protein [bacterium]